MNYMKQVAEMLGVELGERFKLAGGTSSLYCINEKGLIRKDSRNSDEEYFSSILSHLLNGDYEIEKLPRKPEKYEDYYYVVVDANGKYYAGQTTWQDFCVDYEGYVTGNCFKTREEAEAAIPWYKANIERVNRGEKWQVEK